MYRKLALLCTFFSLCISLLFAQGITPYWQIHSSRSRPTDLAVSRHRYYVVADGSLYSVSRSKEHEVKLWSKLDGLHGVDITNILYLAEDDLLLVYYRNGLIDLVYGDESIVSIPWIAQARDIAYKELNGAITANGSRAFLYGKSGVFELSTASASIEGHYFRGQEVAGMSISPLGDIYLLVEGAIYRGEPRSNLQDPSQWKRYSQSNWQSLASYGELILALDSSGGLYRLDGDIATPYTLTPLEGQATIQRIAALEGVLRVDDSAGGTTFLSSDLSKLTREAVGVWGVTPEGNGLVFLKEPADFSYFRFLETSWQEEQFSVAIDGPRSNNFYRLALTRSGTLASVNGGRYYDRYHNPGILQLYDGKSWQAIDHAQIQKQYQKTFLDPVDVIEADIYGKRELFVATWGEGLYRFDALDLKEQYTLGNSSLKAAIANHPNYVRVSSLMLDKDGTLWMAQGGGGSSSDVPIISSLSPEGHWQAYDYSLGKGSNAFGKFLAMPRGNIKYLLDFFLSAKGEGLTIIDNKGTANSDDDELWHFSSFLDNEGNGVRPSKINTMALDREGKLWMGSDIGPFSLNTPELAPQGNQPPRIYRPIGGEEPPYYRVLDNISITAIEVDPMDNKWVGTKDQGVYLLSPDMSRILAHYTIENSPLLDNQVTDLAYDENRGLLYIGTSFGLNILEAPSGDSFSESVYSPMVYPNPLLPEDPDLIFVEPLPIGAKVLMYSPAGSLVKSLVATEVKLKISPYASDGKRLPTGIYHILVLPSEKSKPIHLKVAIVSED